MGARTLLDEASSLRDSARAFVVDLAAQSVLLGREVGVPLALAIRAELAARAAVISIDEEGLGDTELPERAVEPASALGSSLLAALFDGSLQRDASIAAGLRAQRAIKNVSQREAAKAIGANQSTLSGWENNAGIGLEDAWAAADYYGCSLDDLAGRPWPPREG